MCTLLELTTNIDIAIAICTQTIVSNKCVSIGSFCSSCVHRHDMEIEAHNSRTRAHLQGNGKLGSINVPFIDLELDHVIPDELHLMLRVMDVLIQALIDTVLAYDRHQHRLSCSRSSYKALNGPMLNNLVMSIRKCGVCFCLYEQADGSMEWPSLLGPDKLKLLKNLPKEFTNCQPAEMAKDVKKLWKVCSYLARHNGI